MKTRVFAAALVLGAALRAAAIGLPGTHDTAVWKIWSYVAAHEGVARMYGVGGAPLEHRLVSFHGAETTVDYPPLALYELGLAGRAYRAAMGGRFPDAPPLFVAVKLPAVLADAGLLLLLFLVVRRALDERSARLAAIAYWLNPAILLDAPALGYLDPLFVLPFVAALACAVAEMPALAGALAACALLTKPQAAVLMPAIALVLLNRPGWPRRALVATASGAAAALVIIAPILAAGGFPNMLNALSRLGHHDMLSGNACNLWWIVGYLVRAKYSIADMGAWAAFTTPTKILQISRFVEVGYPNPRPIGIVLAGGVMLWGLWQARNVRDLWLASGLAAFLVHAYAVLSAQVHENHLFAAVPLLVLAAAGRRRFVPMAIAVSAIFALNLNLFYGISEDLGYAIPRTLTVIDLTVLVAAANGAALAWHAAVLRTECSTAAAPRRLPAPV